MWQNTVEWECTAWNGGYSRDVNETFSDETETRPETSETLGTVSETRPRRYKLPRRSVKSSKQSPQVAAYRDY